MSDGAADDAGPAPSPSLVRRLLRRSRLSPVGLRRRILLTFGLGALMLSTFLAFTTYGLVRSNLLSQRDTASLRAAYRNAQVVQSALRGEPTTPASATAQLQQLGVQRSLIRYQGQWSAGIGRFGPEALPPTLVQRVTDDEVPARMITSVGNEPVVVVGIPLPELGSYFEFFSLDEDERTLANVALSLLLAAVITTALGILLGMFAARRAVRPVADVASAAKALAGGDLETRLPTTDDPDLDVLVTSFNDMAATLQRRVERDARFASDVSHELRSPLMTLSASVEVMEARRADLPERAQSALDLLASDVSRFQGLVEDLLEISRFDAGAIRLNLEDLPVADFVRHAIAVSATPNTPVSATRRAEVAMISGDRRRLARVVANLVDNSRAYGGGEPTVTIADANLPDEPVSHVQIAFEDDGPGVPTEERALIFERFARGGSAGRRAGSEGAGLGLALVDEHVRMHGGRVWVEDRLDGRPGARFVIELPSWEPAVSTPGIGQEDLVP
ncbi:MAG: HAMP domain-containing histidine kinase [Acidimicrobiia bacterium]|nr:HAMP domain-containing histidine kinase [Acidimicrobiia bacterium]